MLAPQSRTLGALLDEISARHPNRQAVRCEDQDLTYRELAGLADQGARSLLALGVRRGDRVALLMSNRIEWLVTYFAVTKLGAVLVPLNTWHQLPELAWTIRHTQPRVAIIERDFLKRDYGADFLSLISGLRHSEPGALRDGEWPWLTAVVTCGRSLPGAIDWDGFLGLGDVSRNGELSHAQEAVTPEDLAMILYTSGSTAEPKGVRLTHGPTVENCFNIGERRLFTHEDRVWLGSPLLYAFGAVNAIPATVTHGATLVLQGVFDAARAVRVIEREACTVFYATSNIIRAVYEAPNYSRRRTRTLEKGAAGISVAEREIVLKHMGVVHATQSFGMTEVYGHCALGYPDDSLEVKLTTEGCALPGNEMRVVDPATGAPLRTGETGELTIRGFTTPGYYRNPHETNRAIDADGFLHTGDLGSLDAGGYFHFHSRLKELIKTNGINVSPTEVEQILLAHEAVRQAYVVSIPDKRRGELVVAIVEASDGVGEDDLRRYVRSRAASFKVPARVLFRRDDQIPRLVSGKVPRPTLRTEAEAELGGGAD